MVHFTIFPHTKSCIVFVFFLSFNVLFFKLFAYNFSADKDKLTADLRERGLFPGSIRLAIVYEVSNQDTLKTQTDLVRLKKELSYEISRVYSVPDPVITGEILRRNNIQPQDIKTNPTVRTAFFDRNEAGHVLFVNIASESQTVVINYEVMSSIGVPISQFTSRHPLEAPASYNASQSFERESQSNGLTATRPDNSGYSSGSGFSGLLPLGNHNRMTNDTWFYFQQTAVPVPQTHSLEFALWVKDAGDVDLPLKLLRYDLRYERIQIGVQGYGTNDSRYDVHSSYAHVKINLIDDQMFRFPIFASIGGKRGIGWDDKNPELKYKDDKDVEEENKKKNKNSLFLAVTFRLDDIGMLVNTYYDNVFFTAGIKFIVHNYVRFLFDYQVLHIKSDYPQTDTGIFLELLPSDAFLFYVGSQSNTNQTLIGFKFSAF